METKQQNKMNGRKTANDVLIASFRAGVIASAGVLAVLLLTGTAAGGRWVVDDSGGADRMDMQVEAAG